MSKQIAVVESSKFSSQEIALLRETYAKELNDTELRIFLKQAESQGLNPFNKEIYGTKLGGRLVLITSIEGVRKIAHRTGKYMGCKIKLNYDKDGKVYSATAIVKKVVHGHIAEFEAEAFFDEFNTNAGNWKKMPLKMISKVAEMHALKMAFKEVESLVEESEAESQKAIHGEVEVDVHPQDDVHSHQSEPEFQEPGDYVVTSGTFKGVKVKDIGEQKLREYIAWATAQDKLSPPAQEFLMAADAFLLESI